MKFDERNHKIFYIPPFLISMATAQSLSYRFRFVWLISFHFAAVAMETKKGGFKRFLSSFHQIS
jgi:hypothetical protein